VAQKRCDFDEAEKFSATVFVPDNAAKPRDIAGHSIRCLPAIALATRDDLYFPRRSRRDSVVTESNNRFASARVQLRRKVSINRR
jgi:hypothetical protein